MEFQASGTIIFLDKEKNMANNFNMREFAIEIYDPNYPQKVLFQLVNQDIDLIRHHQLGDEVKVTFKINGKEWTGANGTKYFNSLRAVKLENPNAE